MPPSAPDGIFIWKGDASGDWNDAANWQRIAGTGDYPGAGEGFDDPVVLFDNGIPKACDPARDRR